MSNTIRSKILIIEDDPGICTFLRATLTAEGYDAIVVSNGGSALEMAASHCPDCILLDLGLPDMDGNEITLNTGKTWICVIKDTYADKTDIH